ncbi:MAG: AAA family ATPase [Planctomycetota bacterium]
MSNIPRTPAPGGARPPQGGAARRPGPQPAVAPAINIDPMRILRVYWPLASAAFVFSVFFGVVAYLGLLRLAPKFTSEVTFDVEGAAETADATGSLTGAGGNKELEVFLETQALVLQSDRILENAVDEPEVRDETQWAKKYFRDGAYDETEALKALREIAQARVIPDTNVVLMRVTTGSKLDSKTIAEAITQVYLIDVQRRENSDKQDLIQSFEARQRNLRRDLDSLDTRIENLLDEGQLVGLQTRDATQTGLIDNLNGQIVTARESLAAAREQLSTYEGFLNAPGGTQYPETVRQNVEESPIVQQQKSQIAGQRALLRATREEFGPNHREVRRLERTIRALEQERQATVEGQLAEVFAATVENLRSTIDNLAASEADMMQKKSEAEEELAAITQRLKQHDNLQAEREELIAQLAQLSTRITELNLLLDRSSRVQRLGGPNVPDFPSFPSLTVIVPVSVVLVCGLTGGLILLREARETRARGPQDVAAIRGTNVLGIVPALEMDLSNPERIETASIERPDGIIAEQVRHIRSKILKASASHGHKSFTFFSGLPGSGTTSVVLNVAARLAATGRRVLVIDANLRRPRQHELLGFEMTPGLGDVLLDKATLAGSVVEGEFEGLYLLPAGERGDRVYERYTTQRLADIVKQAEESYDIVLVDTPPAVVAGDAFVICGFTDAAVMVVRALSEKLGLIARLRNQINDVDTAFLGVVVNAVKPSAGGYFKRNFRATHEYSRERAADDSTDRDKTPVAAGSDADEPADKA